MLIAFCVALGLIVWACAGYPMIVLLRGRLLRRPFVKADQPVPVSVVIAAYNEAASIRARLENLLSLDYPRELLEIVVVSDGSDDGTVQIAEHFIDQGVRVLDLPRQGKIPALNEALTHVNGDVVVLSDANSHFRTDALKRLTAPFADTQVGGVAGNQVYRKDPDQALRAENTDGERLYWNLDRALKLAQSNSGSVVSATGAIYAMRRSLIQQIPSAVTDDFFLSTGVVDAGARLVFEPAAVAIEPVAARSDIEFGRKVRVMSRGFRSLWMRRRLMNPLRTGFYAIDLWTYKLLKRLIALPLLALLISSLFLSSSHWSFAGLFVAQACFYSLAIWGYLLRRTAFGQIRPLAIPGYFCMVNVAAVCAATNAVLGRRIDKWDTQRGETDEAPQPSVETPASAGTDEEIRTESLEMEVAGS